MQYDHPSGGRRRSGIPAHVVILSIACLSVPLAASALWIEAEAMQRYEPLLWLSALVPPFLLAFHRGWSGAASALATGMAVLSVSHAVMLWAGSGPIPWQLLSAVGVTLILVSLGAGWVSEQLWRRVLLADRNTAELSLVIDASERIRFASASAEAVLGVPHSALERTSILSHVHPDDHALFASGLQSADGRSTDALEIRFQHAGGGYRTLELMIGPVGTKRRSGIRLVGRDVTARRAAEEQLRRTQTMRVVGRMVGVLAHETNNLLTSLTGHLDALEQTVEAADRRRLGHEALQSSSARVHTLLRQLAGFTQQSDLRMETLFLNSFIQQHMHFFQQLLPEGVHLNVSFEDDGGFVAVDVQGLTEALTSIVTNAAEATTQGDDITIRVRRDTIDEERARSFSYPVRPGPYVVAEIEDTGSGMTEDVQRRALEAFFTTRDAPSTLGLGLSAAYGFVKQSGGYLWLRSAPGVGTTVSIHLPEQPEPREAEEGGVPSQTGNHRALGTVLVVEDEPLVLSYMRSVLLRHGYSVLEAADPRDALRQFEQGGVDLVVSDLRMPHIRGDELLLKLRRSAAHLPAVLTSGFTDRDSLDPALFDAPTEVLDKPFSPPELLTAVSRVESHGMLASVAGTPR